MPQQGNSPPSFNKRIFWDVNYEVLDYDKKAGFIIKRIFDRGDVEDIRTCRRYYGDDKIRDALTNAKWLSLSTIYLAAALFNNELTGYRCYNLGQSNPGHAGAYPGFRRDNYLPGRLHFDHNPHILVVHPGRSS